MEAVTLVAEYFPKSESNNVSNNKSIIEPNETQTQTVIDIEEDEDKEDIKQENGLDMHDGTEPLRSDSKVSSVVECV